VILTHGEDGPRAALAKKIQQQFRLPSKLPKMGDVVEL
jgi:predicted metal-dependent RNase